MAYAGVRPLCVGIEVVQWSLAKEGGNCLLNVQHAGRAANHNYALTSRLGYAGIFPKPGLTGSMVFVPDFGLIVKLLAGNDGMNFMAV